MTEPSQPPAGGSFDYIIVGAGSAGCILANRLSEDPNNNVCLLEAGPPDRHIMIKIPLGIMYLMEHKRLNWRFWTTDQKEAGDRPIYIPRGRTVGGSSSINGMVYMRGHRLDYDDWAALGNAGWSYREVLPYFKRTENNEEFGETPYHGTGGPMNVINVDSYSPLVDIMCDAAQQMQMPVTEDFNGAQQEGFGKRQFTIRGGRRESTATAFLHPVRHRKNLTVITDAMAERVTFDGKRANGIDIVVKGQKRHLEARREVIVSSGAIASPTILLRSGVGPADEIARHGIQQVHELPGVGRNLRDHLTVPLQHLSPTTIPYGLSWKTAPWVAWNFLKYPFTGKGLPSNPILHAGGFIRTDPELDRPNIQFILSPALRTPGGRTGIGHGFGLLVILLRPKSIGAIRLSGPGVDARPEIDAQFLSDPADLQLMVDGFKLARRFVQAPAWDKVRGAECTPGASVATDDDVRKYIRDIASTVFHPVGTCKMGHDPEAVVDDQLRVRGIEGLRVVDASIMPTLIGGNTAAPTMMIAEKASDMILGKPPLPAAENV